MSAWRLFFIAGLWAFGEVTAFSEPTANPAQIVVLTPLVASVGDTVRWDFKPMRGSRELLLLSVTGNPLPFGVVPKTEGGHVFLGGKVLGRQFRRGLISVVAFDKGSCDESYAAAKLMTIKNYLSKIATNASLPLDPCSLEKMASNPQNQINATFSWNLIDGPDSLADVKNHNIILQMANVALADSTRKSGSKSSTRNLMQMGNQFIPVNQAPHTFSATVGSCAILPRSRCGDRPNECLWTLNTCVSKDVTGLKEDEGQAK